MKFLEELYQHPLLDSNDLALICKRHRRVSFKKGDYLLKVGQTANEYYCIEAGLIRSCVVNHKGLDITTGFSGANNIVIDVVSLFKRIPSDENIIALTDCRGYSIEFDEFQMLFHSVKGFSEWGRSWMAESLFQCKQRAISMITESAADRYSNLVSRFPQVIQQAPLKHIATYLGITDSSLSRIRKEVAQQVKTANYFLP